MRLGLVTYQIAEKWDVETIIAKCAALGYEAVELRTTHAHGVETGLDKKSRKEAREKFRASSVTLSGLGSTFEYHSPDPAELKKQIEGTREYILLARDVGAQGIKVRPNALPAGVPEERTLRQIGLSLAEVAAFGAEHGVKVRLEIHGQGTSHPPHIRKILDIADHPNLYACWNSNMADLDEEKSIDRYFALLREKIEIVHINELWSKYPWRRLFQLLKESKFSGFCLAEIPANPDADRMLRYYKALFDCYSA